MTLVTLSQLAENLANYNSVAGQQAYITGNQAQVRAAFANPPLPRLNGKSVTSAFKKVGYVPDNILARNIAELLRAPPT